MEFIDDHPVVAHRVRFTRRADIDESQAGHVRDGQSIVWLVRAECLPPSYHPISRGSDDRYRFNVQRVESAIPLQGESLDSAAAYLDHQDLDQGYLNFGRPRYPDNEPGSQLDELVAYLHELGAYREDDTPLSAVQRLVEQRRPEPTGTLPVLFPSSVPEPVMEVYPEDPLASDGHNEIEVVGSIYRNGASKTQSILEEAFPPW